MDFCNERIKKMWRFALRSELLSVKDNDYSD